MHVYETLIIGCGYYSAGYAAAKGNCIICEEHQVCDTGFNLPLRSFTYTPYIPKTEEGNKLFNYFESLALFKDEKQNTHAFEIAFCKYIIRSDINILLKCRIIKVTKREDGILDITIQTNEGLNHLYAKKILNTVNTSSDKMYTVLFVSNDIEKEKLKLLKAFDNSSIDHAFYDGRYALHIPVADSTDENLIKRDVYEKWTSLDTDAKILYMAPTFYEKDSSNENCDLKYKNPIEAFEAGYRYANEK